MTRFAVCRTLAALGLVTSACAPGPIQPAGQSAPFAPKEGATLPVSYAVDGQPQLIRTYQFHQVQGTGVKPQGFRSQATPAGALGGSEQWVMLPTKTESPGAPGGQAGGLTVPAVTPAQVDDFLVEWDVHVNGEGDEGVNAEELVKLLRDEGIELADFVQAYRDSGMSLPAFLSMLTDAEDSVSAAEPTTAFDRLLDALQARGIKLSEFLAALKQDGQSPATFFKRLQDKQFTIDEVFAAADLKVPGSDTTAQALKVMADQEVEPLPANIAMRGDRSVVFSLPSTRQNLDGTFFDFYYAPYDQFLVPVAGRSVRSKDRTVVVGSELTPLARVAWRMEGDYDVRYQTTSERPVPGRWARRVQYRILDDNASRSAAGWLVTGNCGPVERSFVSLREGDVGRVVFQIKLAVTFLAYFGCIFDTRDELLFTKGFGDLGGSWRPVPIGEGERGYLKLVSSFGR